MHTNVPPPDRAVKAIFTSLIYQSKSSDPIVCQQLALLILATQGKLYALLLQTTTVALLVLSAEAIWVVWSNRIHTRT